MNLKYFLENGWLPVDLTIDEKKYDFISKKVINSRPWDDEIFRTYDDVFNNPRHKNIAVKKDNFNLAENLNLDFIENNFEFNQLLDKILGNDYEVILKKFVVSMPEQLIPKWLNPILEKKLDGNLAQYIKPKFRDISYFSGIDYHMDLLDYPDFDGDYLTVYIYFTDVKTDQSPLHIIEKSHIYGATHFPHFLKKSKNENRILYSMDGKKYDEFKSKKLISKRGSIYLWSALTIHGTIKSTNSLPRVALRMSIKKNRNNKNITLIDDLYKDKKIRLEKKTRTDIKIGSDNTLKHENYKRFLI